MDVDQLKQWFLENKRDLPWREEISPYRVWVSEIMLQQTQVTVVIPYFLRWMRHFPTIESLAEASIDEVIKLWEGLGYYSRARNLYAGAKYIVTHFSGQLPSCENELKKIKGLGHYTVGAIRSFAFHQKATAVDGNVIRVITRYYQIGEDISKVATQKLIREKVEKILPDQEPWIFNEALIELGAKVCKKKPDCSKCPLKSGCGAFLFGRSGELPYKSKKIKISTLHRSVAVVVYEKAVLLRKETSGKIMHDLHEFPYFDLSKGELNDLLRDHLSLNTRYLYSLEKQFHSFTQYRVHLYPKVFHAISEHQVKGYDWVPFSDLKKIAFSSGHRKIFHSLRSLLFDCIPN